MLKVIKFKQKQKNRVSFSSSNLNQYTISDDTHEKKLFFIRGMFHQLLDIIKKRQNEIRQKKISFLYKEAFQYYSDLFTYHKLADIDLPEFIYKAQREDLIRELASKAIVDVISAHRIDECYTKRIKQLKARIKN